MRKINYNHHVVASDQRFAYDFLIKMNGATFKNNGNRNEDYYCFGNKTKEMTGEEVFAQYAPPEG